MTDRFVVEDRAPAPALEVVSNVRVMAIPKALARGYGLVNEAVGTLGVELVGAPYARYLGLDFAKLHRQGAFSQLVQLLFSRQQMVAGRRISAPAQGQGEVQATEIPQGAYLVAIHRGPFHKVAETYRAMSAWAAGENLTLADHSIETYLTDPADSKPEDLETEVAIRVL